MPTPVDQASFADLIERFQALIALQQTLVMQLPVMALSGPGPFALTATDHGGKRLMIDNGAAAGTIQVTLPADAPIGTIFLPRQSGAGALKFVTTGSATLFHRQGFNGTAGQWAGVSITRELDDANGNARWVLDGDAAGVV